MEQKSIKYLKQDEREIKTIKEKIKIKDKDWLSDWIQKFNMEDDFWVKEKRDKIKDKDWL